MTDVEALMWALEADPQLSSNFANVSYLDRAPDREVLRNRLWWATTRVPLLRMRVVDAPRPQTPRWVEDTDFDIDRHIRWMSLPKGADTHDLLQLAAALAARPFDIAHPLWEFTVIDGLPDGRAAMVQKLHHTITDGEGGIRMSLAFLDFERDTPQPTAPDGGPPPFSEEHTPDATTATAGVGAPGAFGAALEVMSELTRRSVDAAGAFANSLTDALRDPSQLAATLAALPAESANTAKSLIRQLGVVDKFRSPLWTERSLDRALHVFSIPLADVKDAGHRLGVSVNDLFIAAAAGGAGVYHRDRGVGVDELRLSMPVSTRTTKSVGGNSFTPTRVLVPVTADPRTRLAEIHDRLDVTKREGSLNFTGPLAGLAGLIPPAVLLRLARQQVMTVDFAASNVRAAPFPVYLAGARLESNYPIGPIGGTAWNLTTMSYCGNLDIGLHADAAAVDDPADLAEAIEAEFRALLALD